VLRAQFITLMVMFGTIALNGIYTGALRRLFPQQGHRLDHRPAKSAQDIYYQAMLERQQAPGCHHARIKKGRSRSGRGWPRKASTRLKDGAAYSSRKPKNKRSERPGIARLRPT